MVCPDLPRKELARFLLISRLAERREHFRPHLLYLLCPDMAWSFWFGTAATPDIIMDVCRAISFPIPGRKPSSSGSTALFHTRLFLPSSSHRNATPASVLWTEQKVHSRVAYSASPRIRLLPTSSQGPCFSRFTSDDHRGPADRSLRQLWKAELGGGKGGAWEDHCPMTPVCS